MSKENSRPPPPTTQHHHHHRPNNRSVVDYETEDALRKALMAVTKSNNSNSNSNSNNSKKENGDNSTTSASLLSSSSTTSKQQQQQPGENSNNDDTTSDGGRNKKKKNPGDEDHPSKTLDWVLPSYDPETTEEQSLKEELRRLQVLKSYLILDSDREAAFERITGLAARIFNVPIALVSLVDLGRQWFMSNRGLPGDVRETPRRFAFCAHVILDKRSILIVRDAASDFRFRNNPLVTGPPHIRFYAGVPLVSPEGYKLGTVCIIDNKTRPEGLTADEQTSLHDLAEMTVKVMVDRRYQLQTQENPAQLIAYTAHDLMTPLTGVQLSLSLLKEDEELRTKLGPHQAELLTTASNCSDLMIRICKTAIETLRQESSSSSSSAAPSNSSRHNSNSGGGGGGGLPMSSSSPSKDNSGGGGGGGALGGAGGPATKMKELVTSLLMIMEPIPKKVPLVITLDPSVPAMVMGDDLKLFRSALNLLSHAVARTELGLVHLRIYPRDDSRNLVFECEDTGANIEVEEYQYLFQPSRKEDGHFRLGLSSVASLINSLDGEYGFRPRGGVASDGSKSSAAVDDGKGRQKTGSVFWFSVPLLDPAEEAAAAAAAVGGASLSPSGSAGGGGGGGGGGGALNNHHHDLGSQVVRRVGSAQHLSPAATRLSVSVTDGACFSNLFKTFKKSPNSAATRIPAEDSSNSNNNSNKGAAWQQQQQHQNNSAKPSSGSAAVDDDRKMPALPQLNNDRSSGPAGGIGGGGGATRDESSSPEKKKAAAPVVGVASRKRKRRALVIDDSLVVRKSLAMALKRLGYDVSQAVNGLEGLRHLKETLFELCLCDFLMPVMDGMDCVKQYRDWERQNRPWFRQLIVGISAHASANDGGQGILVGMDDFKPKPISMMTLGEIHRSDAVSEKAKILGDLEEDSSTATPAAAGGDDGGTGSNSLEVVAAAAAAAAPPPAAAAVVDGDGPGDNDNNNDDDDGDDATRNCVATTKAATSSHKRDAQEIEPDCDTVDRGGADQVEYIAKHRRQLANHGPDDRVCLIATDNTPTVKLSNEVLVTKLEGEGWKVVVVHDGKEALRLLEMRNWDAVLIDDDVPELSGASCATNFRRWEDRNRVNRQRNLFLVVCDGDIPSPHDKKSTVQPPSSFDGVLSKPVNWYDLQFFLQQSSKKSRDFEIIVRH